MGSDFLFHQKRLRHHASYYHWYADRPTEFFEPEEGTAHSQADRIFKPRRAAASAYDEQPQRIPPDLIAEEQEITKAILPESAPGPRRAANTAYEFEGPKSEFFITPTGPIDEELNVSAIPDFATGPRRAANDAYWIQRRFNPEAPIPVELIKSIQPEIARTTERATRDSYEFKQRIIEDPGPEITTKPLFPDRADGFKRAANDAYELPKPAEEFFETPPTEQIDEELNVSAITDIARGPRRAANDAYRLNFRKFNPSDEAQAHFNLGAPSNFRIRRAANDAYELRRQLNPSDRTQRHFYLTPIFDPQRAARDAYDFQQPQEAFHETPSAQVPEELRKRIQPDFARAAERATQDAYEFRQRIIEDPGPEITTRQLFPDRADGPRRAANRAYDILQERLPEKDLPVELRRRILPQRPRAASRTANTAYEFRRQLNPVAAVAELPEELARSISPSRPRAPQRTANDAYWMIRTVDVDGLPPPISLEGIYIPVFRRRRR